MSAPFTGISSMATRQVLAELGRATAARRRRARFESVGGVDAAHRVRAGEVFDVVVLAADAIDRLAAAGRIVADSVRDRRRRASPSRCAQGAPRPAIGREDALRDAVLAARRIGYSTGPSGTALQRALRAMGHRRADAATDSCRRHRGSGGALARRRRGRARLPAAERTARRGASTSSARCRRGWRSSPPSSARSVRRFDAGRRGARALLDFIRSPAADETKRRHGMAAWRALTPSTARPPPPAGEHAS